MNIKKVLLLTFASAFFAANPVFAEISLAEKLSGKILLQVESYGRAWYFYPKDNSRYYLKDGETAYAVMSSLGLGISNADLAKIPVKKGDYRDSNLVNRLKGRIVLQVEERGEAWYINPDDGLRYYMKDGDAAYSIMRTFALGIKDSDLEQIPINHAQIVPDTAYSDVAYTSLFNNSFQYGYFDDTILPLASLTKLMTALVIVDMKLDWDKKVTITQEIIDYPVLYVGDDRTSEIDIAIGDTMSFYDLWIAMLLASSNQAAAGLVDALGFNIEEFVELMNAKARDLDFHKTVFFDVAGLDSHNAATPQEMALIAHKAFERPIISEITTLKDYTIHAQDSVGDTKPIEVTNRNYSLLDFNPDGVKTGYLVEAGRNAALKKDDKIIVVMHARSMKERNNIITRLLQ